MEKVNALTVRKSLGAVLDRMQALQQPVMVTRDRKPAAVLVPLALFQERFVDFLAEAQVDAAMQRLESLQSTPHDTDSLSALRDLRQRES